MAKTSQRVIAVIIALLFLVSSIAFSVFVIWDMTNNNDTTASDSQAIEELLENQRTEGQLEGTKLENFTPVSGVSELQIIDIEEGTGEVVPAGATVTAHYTGALALDGTIFQSSHDGGEPVSFPLDGVIKGWAEGVPGMKVGGKRRLIIPAALAYGDQSPAANIPPNSDLVFDIELVKLGE